MSADDTSSGSERLVVRRVPSRGLSRVLFLCVHVMTFCCSFVCDPFVNLASQNEAKQ